MNKRLQHLVFLSIHAGFLGLLSVTATAQLTKYAVTPAGHEFHPGNSNNTYPFRGVSSHYQQIHDATDMMSLHGGGVQIMTHMGFRPASTFNIPARQWDVQISLSPTTVTAAAMSTTFSANATTTPTVVLPYTTLKAAAGKGLGSTVPNKILWSFPFKQLYIYTPGPGRNLLWEWQSKNGGTQITTPMDACSGTTRPVLRGASIGSGCTPTGKTLPAQAQVTVAGTASLSLANAAASAQALLWIGVQRTNLTGPGWCSTLYLNPLIVVAGNTNSAGTWNAASVPASSLPATRYWEAFAQFGFADKGLVGGFGLSNMAVFSGPANRGHHVSRLYRLSGANGSETAATGSRGTTYGLITMFTIK